MFNSYLENTLVLDVEKCNGCTLCAAVCPHQVFAIIDHRSQIINPTACMECGACMVNCATGAIIVHSGVGCAAAMINAALTGKKEASCGCC
jgi:NAD-dependent dihydropyrimidine dehydrogenase PreA subunit